MSGESPIRRHSPRFQHRENESSHSALPVVSSTTGRSSSSQQLPQRRPPQQPARQRQQQQQQHQQQRQGRSTAYTKDEIMSFLQVVEHFLPITCDQWDQVADDHFSICNIRRSGDSLKSKFQNLYRARPSTGDPSVPEDVQFVKRIRHQISRKINTSNVGPDSQEDTDDDNQIELGNEVDEDLLARQQDPVLPSRTRVQVPLPSITPVTRQSETTNLPPSNPPVLPPSTSTSSSETRRFRNNITPRGTKSFQSSSQDMMSQYFSRADLLLEQERIRREERDEERREERLRLEDERREERRRWEEERREERQRREDEILRREDERRRRQDERDDERREERLRREAEQRRWEMMFAAVVPVLNSFKKDESKE